MMAAMGYGAMAVCADVERCWDTGLQDWADQIRASLIRGLTRSGRGVTDVSTTTDESWPIKRGSCPSAPPSALPPLSS